MELDIIFKKGVLYIGEDLEIRIKLGQDSEDLDPNKEDNRAYKKCPKCLKKKPLSEFGLRFMKRDKSIRLQSRCKGCRHKY